MLRAYSAPFSLPGSTEPARNNPLFCTFSVLFRSFLALSALFVCHFCPFSVPFSVLPLYFLCVFFSVRNFRAWLFFPCPAPPPSVPSVLWQVSQYGLPRNSHGIARNTPASYLHHVRHGSARSCKTRLCSKHGTPACRISKRYNFTSADIAKCIHTTLCKSSFRIHTTERQFNALFCSRISTEAAPLCRLYGQPKIEKYIHTILCILRREKMHHNAYICITQKLRCFPGYEPTQKHRSRRIKGVENCVAKFGTLALYINAMSKSVNNKIILFGGSPPVGSPPSASRNSRGNMSGCRFPTFCACGSPPGTHTQGRNTLHALRLLQTSCRTLCKLLPLGFLSCIFLSVASPFRHIATFYKLACKLSLIS